MRIAKYAAPLFQPKRYKVLYGGRGSGKSYAAADCLLILGVEKPIRVLCGREFQNSISESCHKLLAEESQNSEFLGFYQYNRESVWGKNGTEFIFKGVRNNVQSIKSIVGVTHLWLEEAHTISKHSWDVLIPTIREPNSEIWVTFNPENDDDPTYTMFVDPDGNPLDRDDAIILNVNWNNNDWFPDVLAKEKDRLYEKNPDLASHVWGGKCRRNAASQIFRGRYSVREFEYQYGWDGPYFGADWGFAQDPSVLVKVYLDLPGRRLYVRDARFGFGTEIDQLPALFDKIRESRDYLIRADSARPETINYVGRQGFAIEGVEKWKGSVEDGIEWLKSFDEIVFHPETEQEFEIEGEIKKYGMITEAKNYSYKVDRLTQDVLNDVVDAFNHGWDAIRYACQPMIMAGSLSILDVDYKCTEASR